MISFTVPGQPVAKGRPRIGRAGIHARLFAPTKTVNYEALVKVQAHVAMNSAPLIQGPVILEMDMLMTVPESWSKKKRAGALEGSVYPTTKPDADNCLKAICDALNGVVWRDDTQVVDVILRKRYSDKPMVQVRIKEIV